jgi:hypothetical protein
VQNETGPGRAQATDFEDTPGLIPGTGRPASQSEISAQGQRIANADATDGIGPWIDEVAGGLWDQE